MRLQRRKVLMGLGIGAVAVATAGAGLWARRAWYDRQYLRPRFNSVRATSFSVSSPGERLHAQIMFEAAGGSAPRWSVHHDERAVLQPEPLELTLADSRRLGPGAQIIGQQLTRLHDNAAAKLSGECNELAVQMLDGATGIMFDIMVRAYDAGVALGSLVRYMPEDETLPPFSMPWRVVLLNAG